MPNNGKSYTEVVAELNGSISDMRVEMVDRINDGNKDILDRLDGINSGLARGDERYKAQEKRIEDNATDIKANAGNIVKVRNLNATLTAFFSGIAAFVGWNQ